jgi:hypothetical protein
MSVATIQAEVLTLPPLERARLIDGLWDSLSSPEVRAREAAWAVESEPFAERKPGSAGASPCLALCRTFGSECEISWLPATEAGGADGGILAQGGGVAAQDEAAGLQDVADVSANGGDRQDPGDTGSFPSPTV